MHCIVFKGQLLVLFGLSVHWNTCFYISDFISITCIFDRLCSQINDDDDADACFTITNC